jgi:hypothetical protein
VSTDAIRTAEHDAPTTELVAGAVGDRCPNCEAPLASDQRYCVACGERRGRPRFSFTELASSASPPPATADPPIPAPRAHPGLTLVAGVATLLIAIAVGVVIGVNANSGTPTRAAAPYVVTVNGGGAAGAAPTSGATAAGTGPAAATSTRGSHVNAAPAKVRLTKKTTAAATNAASKVLGSSGNLTPNVTQKVGGACSGGAGCQNGKFTGNAFPGG